MSPTAATDMAAVAEEESCIYALQLASLSILPMTLRGAIELGLLEVLEAARKKGGGRDAALAPAEVIARLPEQATNPDAPAMVDRMLRLLASYDVVRCETAPEEEGKKDGVVPRRYRAAPVCKWFAPDEDGVSMAPFVIMNLDKVSMASWYHLKDAVLHGGVPFDLAHGVNMFEHNEEDPGEFNEAMANHSVIVTRKLLDTCGDALFDGVGTLVDVGGGVGATLHAITSRYPRIEGINFDLPHVVAGAPAYPGVRHVGGDMFASAVPSGDAILMKWVIHNWSDDKCVGLLRSCHAALPAHGGGKVIVVESVLPEEPEPTREAQGTLNFDVMMLAQTPSGKERYEREFRELAGAAGFAGFKLTYIYANACAIELTK